MCVFAGAGILKTTIHMQKETTAALLPKPGITKQDHCSSTSRTHDFPPLLALYLLLFHMHGTGCALGGWKPHVLLCCPGKSWTRDCLQQHCCGGQSFSTTLQLYTIFCDSWVPQLQGNWRDDLVSFSICFLELIKLNFPDLKSSLV